MNELTWVEGLMIWIIGGMVAAYLWGLFCDTRRRQREWEKRQDLKRLRRLQRGRAAQREEQP